MAAQNPSKANVQDARRMLQVTAWLKVSIAGTTGSLDFSRSTGGSQRGVDAVIAADDDDEEEEEEEDEEEEEEEEEEEIQGPCFASVAPFSLAFR